LYQYVTIFYKYLAKEKGLKLCYSKITSRFFRKDFLKELLYEEGEKGFILILSLHF